MVLNEKKKKSATKVKIPQKLIDNRRQEIVDSLHKIPDDDQIVINGVPRAFTGSKRGSNFRGVSVNGKKWQVRIIPSKIYYRLWSWALARNAITEASRTKQTLLDCMISTQFSPKELG
jgi:hypothetical protein